ncbi:MAG: hypothetical protein WC971_04320 [Coriobacteriia bacterium]
MGVLATIADDGFEAAAARFVAAAARELPEDLATLAFASPLAVRSPDLSLLWHEGLRRLEPRRVTRAVLAAQLVESAKGFVRLLTTHRRFAWKAYGSQSGKLLVATAICGEERDGVFVTPYVPTVSDDAVFVFGTTDRLASGATPVRPMGFGEKLRIASRLAAAGARALREAGGTARERVWLHSTWEAWSFGLAWLHDRYLDRALDDHLDARTATAVGCIHEMHPYARVVWRVAAARGLERRAVQHAAVTEGKRWYFPQREELEAGLAVPDVLFAFDERVAELLRPALTATRFPPGCSGRYVGWKAAEPLVAPGRCVLAAGALARFENDTLLAAVARLVRDGSRLPVRVRLHPFADVSRADRRRLASWEREGRVEVSRGVPLSDDLSDAAVVLGMGTTVLEEALLLGRPVVQLTDERYVRYVDVEGVSGALVVDAGSFEAADIERAADLAVDPAAVRASLGLDHPVVDYARLFSG